jgi:hypothetical protein
MFGVNVGKSVSTFNLGDGVNAVAFSTFCIEPRSKSSRGVAGEGGVRRDSAGDI